MKYEVFYIVILVCPNALILFPILVAFHNVQLFYASLYVFFIYVNLTSVWKALATTNLFD